MEDYFRTTDKDIRNIVRTNGVASLEISLNGRSIFRIMRSGDNITKTLYTYLIMSLLRNYGTKCILSCKSIENGNSYYLQDCNFNEVISNYLVGNKLSFVHNGRHIPIDELDFSLDFNSIGNDSLHIDEKIHILRGFIQSKFEYWGRCEKTISHKNINKILYVSIGSPINTKESEGVLIKKSDNWGKPSYPYSIDDVEPQPSKKPSKSDKFIIDYSIFEVKTVDLKTDK